MPTRRGEHNGQDATTEEEDDEVTMISISVMREKGEEGIIPIFTGRKRRHYF